MSYKQIKNSSKQLIVNLLLLILVPFLSHAEVTLEIGSGSGVPGSNDNPVEVRLDNPEDAVKGIQVDICDEDNYLTGTACETTDRSGGFACSTNELENGCATVILIPLTGSQIEAGTGPVFNINYDVSGEALEEECKALNTANVNISDDKNQFLESTAVPGEFCFRGSMTTTITIPTTTTTAISFLWPLAYGKLWGVEKERNLLLLRSFRDEVLVNNDVGQDYVFLLYSNSLEIVTLLLQNPSLCEEVKEVIDALVPHIEALLESRATSLSMQQVSHIEALLSHFESQKTSPRLKNAVLKVKKDLREGVVFRQFGITVN